MTGIAEWIIYLWLAVVVCNIILPLALFALHGCIHTIITIWRVGTREIWTLVQPGRTIVTNG